MNEKCGCERGVPFDGTWKGWDEQCRNCWLYHNDPRYKAFWDGEPIPEQAKPQSGPDPECVKKNNQPGQPPEEPSLIRKAFNFGGAVLVHAVQGFPQATPEEAARRISICENCLPVTDPIKGFTPGYFNAETRVCTHKSCGCFVDRKTPWLDQKCPIGKW